MGTRPRASACRKAPIEEKPNAVHNARPQSIGPCLSIKSCSILSARRSVGTAVVICHALLHLNDTNSRDAKHATVAQYFAFNSPQSRPLAYQKLLYFSLSLFPSQL